MSVADQSGDQPASIQLLRPLDTGENLQRVAQNQDATRQASGRVSCLRWGKVDAPIVVLCEPPSEDAWVGGYPLDLDLLKYFALLAKSAGFSRDDIQLVGLCPPLPGRIRNSARLKWEHVAGHVPGVTQTIAALAPRCIVTLGELATRAMLGRPVKITKVRGVALPVELAEGQAVPVLPMLAPSFVRRIPDHEVILRADLGTLARLRQADYAPRGLFDDATTAKDYQWRHNIADVVAELQTRLAAGERPVIAVDTETTGLNTRVVDVLTVQLATGPGKAYVCPVDRAYDPRLSKTGRRVLLNQLRTVLEDPRIAKVAHNASYDHQVLAYRLGILVKGWHADTMIEAFAVDENLIDKSLDSCIRVWVPAMSGYNDSLNLALDKSNMRATSHADMLAYAGGDPDATLRLHRVLTGLLVEDPSQLNLFRRVQMPAAIALMDAVERAGTLIDQDRLAAFGVEVRRWIEAKYAELIQMVPGAVRRKYLRDHQVTARGKKKADNPLKFSRPDFVRDILFSADGFGLDPKVYTKTTAELDWAERVASTSGKQHLIYFVDRGDAAGEFCAGLMQYQSAVKLETTYIGQRAGLDEEGESLPATGVWRYIQADGAVYPTYWLSRTNTGRTSSSNPNGQNRPKRGVWAKAYGRTHIARPGFVLIAADLSQIELRIMAWMAGDPVMLQIYRDGGDIHLVTAASIRFRAETQHHGIAWVVANCWPGLAPEEQARLRRSAKIINFGFLYSMTANGFKRYAKTEYNQNYSDSQAQLFRRTFFQTYPAIAAYHEAVVNFAQEHGYVRALHGALRRLPSIYSTDSAIRALAERQAINAPIQRFASDLGVMAMARFTAQCRAAGLSFEELRISGFVHDQLVAEVRTELAEDAAGWLKWCMENQPLGPWFGLAPPVPILSNVEIGANLGDMVEHAEIAAVRPAWWQDDEEAALAQQLHVSLLTA